MTTIGTCNFVSRVSAMLYYRNNGNETLTLAQLKNLVEEKIKEKSIAIGIPAHKPREIVFPNSEGRYHIRTIN